jgi:hypothetical protein
MSNKGPGSDSGATFPVLADEYYLDFTPDSSQAVTSANYYVSFGPKFKIDKEGTMFASGAKFVGTITASAGKLGGFNIGSASIYGGGSEGIPDFFLSGSQGHGSTGYNKSNLFISSSGFQVTHDGALKSTSGSIGGWTIIDNMLKSSDGNMRINAGNQKITINSHTFGNEGIQIDYNSGTPRMYVGDGSNEFLKWDGSNLSFKGASSELSTAGAFTATAGAIGGWTLASTSLSAGSGGTYIALIPGTGIQMGHGTFGSAPFSVTNAGFVSATSGKIGGWNVGANSISSSNLNISSTGLLETSDYASGFKGWRISSQDNGFAEFENVRIRGTLKTAVFEKETVNAVGGQLYIANSTTITGSHDVGVSDTTIQLANASGFAAGEVLTIKKVTATGFGTEYVRVVSAARVDAGTDTLPYCLITTILPLILVSLPASTLAALTTRTYSVPKPVAVTFLIVRTSPAAKPLAFAN